MNQPRTWFTSDLHLGHPFVAELRGYGTSGEIDADVERHDATILNNLTSALAPGDTLWVLGDISSGWGPQEERALDLLAQAISGLDVTVHLISGNHDSCHPLHANSADRQRRFLEVFDSVQPYQCVVPWDPDGDGVADNEDLVRKADTEVAWLCHFPRPGQDHEGMESRYDSLRLDVPYVIHGHLHSAAPITGPGQVDVGVDAWGLRPAPYEEVMDLLYRDA